MSAVKKTYILKLYVAGNTPNSIRALKTLNTILEEDFQGVYALKVIDVLQNPQLAEEDKILATPTLSKILAAPGAQDHWRFIGPRTGSDWARSSL
jgi:circadian clock protein KaiB